jgi:hypothetical protein
MLVYYPLDHMHISPYIQGIIALVQIIFIYLPASILYEMAAANHKEMVG